MMETVKVTVQKLPQAMQVQANVHGHTLLFDEPEDKGSTNLAPTPVETMLAALGACQTMVAWLVAPKMRVDLRGFSVEIEGDLDTARPPVRKGVVEVRYTMHFQSDAPQETLEKLAALIEKNCPVGDTLGNATRLVRTGVVRD